MENETGNFIFWNILQVKVPGIALWRHQMETFSALLAFCAGNSPVPGEFPAQRPVARSFDVFFDLRLNKQLSKQPWGWWFETHPCHYNVIVMKMICHDFVTWPVAITNIALLWGFIQIPSHAYIHKYIYIYLCVCDAFLVYINRTWAPSDYIDSLFEYGDFHYKGENCWEAVLSL